jgi:hypothetical protein
MNINGIPKKERLLTARLRDFVENDRNDSVAVIAGIRKVGKTTILEQIENHYIKKGLTVLKFDLAAKNDSCEVLEEIAEKEPDLLLLDEISYLDDYERFSQALYNLTHGENNKKFKVIMTGSSSAHIMKLSGTKLGGRAKLFRLPPLTFVEYLYFTDRIASYSEYNAVTNDDFSNYLQLKGLEKKAAGLAITFDEDYFNAFYDEVAVSNKKSYLSHSITSLNENDLPNMINLLAYKLSEACAYEKVTDPKIGAQEHFHLVSNREAKLKWRRVDLSNTIIEDSVKAVPGMSEADIARIVNFLLWSGLANIEYTRINSDAPVVDSGRVLGILHGVKKKKDLEDLFAEVSICMTSPLYYTRIGEEIIRRMQVPVEKLYKGILYGKMLELYVRGALSAWGKNTILTSHKLKYSEIEGEDWEVDICDTLNRVLLEVSAGDKDDENIHVQDYFKEHDFIRICTSNQKDYFNKKHRFYQIPHAKLCCMIDTGDIFTRLSGTNIINDLDVDSIADKYKKKFGEN